MTKARHSASARHTRPAAPLAASLAAVAMAAFATMGASPSMAADSTADAIAQYRQMLADGNPAELIEMRGEELWKTPRGPNNVALTQCDLGLGAGVVKGAYAQLPRYFPDVHRVQDAESRIVECMVTLQGFKREDVIKQPFSKEGQDPTDLESLTAYVAGLSRGETIRVPQSHKEEKDAYARGQKLFYYRAGPYDFSCASCHGADDKRIRLQDLPNLTKPAAARQAFATWPGYRVSQGALRTIQWRMYDCFRQQRMPELNYGSQASIDLITFLGVMANGGKMDAPGLKR
ncbi:SoxAX cytochrome complex subunit A [Pandoraea terrae]|uniref:SoxAX cytochrome complex subunit A n=1 Tax=Pandoraea terrae TaxID=1537710 RepID=A0A5E4Y6P1_9BURK|nr:sulfur oxidation c-type cytochrome SoxA [Pandoraea terrae]VVE44260.1 SoxAX cytochrome complex subunit A [Pandoraea terrae]